MNWYKSLIYAFNVFFLLKVDCSTCFRGSATSRGAAGCTRPPRGTGRAWAAPWARRRSAPSTAAAPPRPTRLWGGTAASSGARSRRAAAPAPGNDLIITIITLISVIITGVPPQDHMVIITQSPSSPCSVRVKAQLACKWQIADFLFVVYGQNTSYNHTSGLHSGQIRIHIIISHKSNLLRWKWQLPSAVRERATRSLILIKTCHLIR